MSDELDSRTPFNFRLARDDIDRAGAQLTGLTNQVDAVNSSIGICNAALKRKRGELRRLTVTIGKKKKTLESLKLRSERALAKASKRVNTTNCAADDANITFMTQDMSFAAVSAIMSPSPQKRKRFAGIWDEVDFEMEHSVEHVEKRARIDSTHCSGIAASKENDDPAEISKPEAGSSCLTAQTIT